MKVQAKKVYTINWDGSEEDYVRCAEDLSHKLGRGGLDSHDAGDATGEFCHWADLPDSDGDFGPFAHMLSFEGHMLTVDTGWEKFEYEGEWN